MVSVSISELKARLSEHIRRVKAGERVVVTERGRAVAVLAPASVAEGQDPELQELIDAGLVTPPRHRESEGFWDLPRGRDPKGAVLAALLEEREESR